MKIQKKQSILLKKSSTLVKNKKEGKGIKILTCKEILQILPIALAQVKADNSSKNLLNKIRHIIYSLHREEEVTKKYTAI